MSQDIDILAVEMESFVQACWRRHSKSNLFKQSIQNHRGTFHRGCSLFLVALPTFTTFARHLKVLQQCRNRFFYPIAVTPPATAFQIP
jgi:hypothetical protein